MNHIHQRAFVDLQKALIEKPACIIGQLTVKGCDRFRCIITKYVQLSQIALNVNNIMTRYVERFPMLFVGKDCMIRCELLQDIRKA